MSDQPQDGTNNVSEQNFDKQGHRGCRGLMPENTIPAMLYAIDLGVTTLEMDVVISKDGKVVLSHEPFFNHEISTKPDGTYIEELEEKNYNIYQMNYDEVKTFDVGLKPHPRFPHQQKMKAIKPLLSDLVDSLDEHMKTRRRGLFYYNIETKTTPATDNIFHPGPEEFVEKLMKVIIEKNIPSKVIIQSFDIRTLKYLHEKYPDVTTALLIEEGDGDTISEKIIAMGFMPAILSPHYSLVTKKLLSDWHAHQRKVIPWTVNEKEKIESLKKMGVDGIITDYPELFRP
jgi:glycerophosphoryl diester phosphodiesterase